MKSAGKPRLHVRGGATIPSGLFLSMKPRVFCTSQRKASRCRNIFDTFCRETWRDLVWTRWLVLAALTRLDKNTEEPLTLRSRKQVSLRRKKTLLALSHKTKVDHSWITAAGNFWSQVTHCGNFHKGFEQENQQSPHRSLAPWQRVLFVPSSDQTPFTSGEKDGLMRFPSLVKRLRLISHKVYLKKVKKNPPGGFEVEGSRLSGSTCWITCNNVE